MTRSHRLCTFVLLVVLGVSPPVRAAFHDGGVASCGGCHVMHASDDGVPVDVGPDQLRAGTASDTCLLCHSSGPWSVLGPSPLVPTPELGGGDFAFLFEDELNDAVVAPGPSLPGERAGHNVVAPGSGLLPDARWTTSPGGNFPSSALGCTSCHDPHGSGAFRMLAGVGPVQDGLFTFMHPAPAGEGIDADATSATESGSDHTAYQGGWSAWCSNCHSRVHRDGSVFEHPVDETLDGEVVQQYVRYEGDGSPDTGTSATAYLPQVPFSDPSVTTSSTEGPTGSSRISCMTCHRAHASSGPQSGRWDFRVNALGADGSVSGSYAIPNPYLDPMQRQLCVKCHDTEGHDRGRSCHQCHGSGRGPGGPGLPDIGQQ